ncbi:signal transduction histidine kinase [Bradyrhizobium sp. F1.4.3]
MTNSCQMLPDAPVIIHGNSEMLQRAIFNLAENAIKFTAKDTSVDVEVGEDGSVRVRDCGPGIAKAERKLIFQRFWRADRQRSDGAGLGLSIVRGVADDHAATVAVEEPAGRRRGVHAAIQAGERHAGGRPQFGGLGGGRLTCVGPSKPKVVGLEWRGGPAFFRLQAPMRWQSGDTCSMLVRKPL